MNKSIYRLLGIFAAFALTLGNSYTAGTSSIYAAGAAANNDEIHWTITGANSVTLDWRGPSNTIRYGITTAYGETVIATVPSPMPFSSAGPFWEAKLTGLLPNTTYHYSIGGDADHTFKTALPKGSSGFTVDVIGDVGDTTSYKNVGPIQAMIAADQPSLALIVGDLTYGNAHGQTVVDQHFNDVQAWTLGSTAYMPAWGNHEWDTGGDNLNNYKGRFDFPNPQTSSGSPAISCCGEDWYYFDYGNVRFIAYPEPWSGAWSDWNTHAQVLMDEAQADSAITFIVTFGHRPAYSSGYHPGNLNLQGYLDGLGASHSKYVLNLNGHSHNYERTFPQSNVVHITAGTGGSNLEQVGACLWGICNQPSWSAKRYMHLGILRLTFNAHNIQGEFVCGPVGSGVNDIACTQGNVIDSFTINDSGSTPTDTPTPSSTAAFTPTGTATFTATNTATFTPSQTFTPTPTPSNTPTFTFTPSNTPTQMFTPTATYTSTATATLTATNTPLSPTAIQSFTPTSTPVPLNTPTSTVPAGTKHFTVNEDGAYTETQAIGFNIHDTGMSTSRINSLPAGSQAMVWVGIGAKNCSTTLSSKFTSFVLANATNPKLYGFYLTDEPLDNTCVAAVTAYTNYIHAKAPGKKAFILLTDWPGTYTAYRPAVTHVDLIGLDPYPVKHGKYDNTLIPSEFNKARAAGIPLANIVPVFQTFGGAGWDAPTAAQLTTILDQWAALVPTPPLDYAYSWGTQSNYLSNALVNRADWREIMAAHNQGLILITGNAGAAGVTLSYTDGTAKTATSQVNGNYSLVVPDGWSGTVTPTHACYTFDPIQRTYSNVTSNQLGQDYTATFMAASGCANIDVTVGGDPKGNYGVPPKEEEREYYNVSGGPVVVHSTNAVDIVSAIRLQSLKSGTLHSFVETMGVPDGLLSYKYYFPTYNNTWGPLNSQIRFGNLDANPTTIRVTIGGAIVWEQVVPGNEERRLYFDVSGGPVIIESLDPTKKIAAAIRLQSLKSGTLYSFSETMGIPVEQLSTTYYFPTYNNIWGPLNSQLRIGNLNAGDVTVRVTIGSNVVWEDLVPGLQEKRLYFDVSGGPVKVESLTAGKNIVAAIRLQSLKSGTLHSFVETMGVPSGLLSYKYYFPTYNNTWGPLNSQIRFGNLDANPTTIRVTIGGTIVWEQVVPGNEERRLYFDVSGGPVIIESLDPTKKIAAAIRLQSKPGSILYSFSETMGIPIEQLSTTYYFPTYNNTWGPLNSQLRFGVP